jgi:hypothetical protein
MTLLILTEACLFAILLFSYYYMALHYGRAWLPPELPGFRLSGPNTAILIVSSVAVWARRGSHEAELALGLLSRAGDRCRTRAAAPEPAGGVTAAGEGRTSWQSGRSLSRSSSSPPSPSTRSRSSGEGYARLNAILHQRGPEAPGGCRGAELRKGRLIAPRAMGMPMRSMAAVGGTDAVVESAATARVVP